METVCVLDCVCVCVCDVLKYVSSPHVHANVGHWRAKQRNVHQLQVVTITGTI